MARREGHMPRSYDAFVSQRDEMIVCLRCVLENVCKQVADFRHGAFKSAISGDIEQVQARRILEAIIGD